MKLPNLDRSRAPADLVDALWAVRRTNDTSRRDEVALLATHEDGIVRQEALSLLLTKWRDIDFRPLAMEMVQSDEDVAVRSRAALGIASVSSTETRAADVALLRGILLDSDEDVEVRRSCYEALSLIDGRKPPPLNADFDFGRDVELEWVRRM